MEELEERWGKPKCGDIEKFIWLYTGNLIKMLKQPVKPMNILFFDRWRGKNVAFAMVHSYEVLSNLSKLGHNVTPISTDIRRNTEKGGAKQQLSLWERVKNSLRSSLMYRLFRGEISIFRVFLNEIYIFLSALILIMKQKTPFDVIYRRHNLFASQYFLAKLFGIPSVKEVNGIIADETRTVKGADRLALRIIDRIERFNLPKADRIIVVTSKLKDVLREDYGVPDDQIVVIENGANPKLFKPIDTVTARKELNLPQCENYICFVGNLVRWQGVEHLIKAAPLVLESCPDTRFLIVGDGALRGELIELTEQLGLSGKVIFTGMVPYHKVPLYIGASDVCVVPKKPMKSGYSPLKLYEYMACEKPVIATRTSGFEILEEHDAGVLVNPENAQEFAGCITRLLQNPELRKVMGENGRKYVVENRSWEIVARKVADVCQQTLQDYKKQHECR